MKTNRELTVIIRRQDESNIALCPELDIVTQGGTVERARANLVEGRELFFECAHQSEISRRLHSFSD